MWCEVCDDGVRAMVELTGVKIASIPRTGYLAIGPLSRYSFRAFQLLGSASQ